MGEVLIYEAGIVKVKGYTFVKDMFSGNMQKKSDLRTKVMSIVSGTLIVYQLPVTALLDSMRFSLDQDGGLVLTDEGDSRWMCRNPSTNTKRINNKTSLVFPLPRIGSFLFFCLSVLSPMAGLWFRQQFA